MFITGNIVTVMVLIKLSSYLIEQTRGLHYILFVLYSMVKLVMFEYCSDCSPEKTTAHCF